MNGAQVVAKNILKKIRSCGIQHKESEADDHITVSIGGTTAIVKHLHNGSDYIKNADKALYESKKTDATDTHLRILGNELPLCIYH